MISRRKLLIAAVLERIRAAGPIATAAFGGLGATSSDGASKRIASTRQPAPGALRGRGSLTLTLDFGARSLTFSESEAVDLGDYVGEFVHQKCRMVAHGDWRVFFRPDADGSRDEVVVEYGRSTVGPVAHLMAPYSATITKGGTPLHTVTVPRHWWGGRWRWQSAPRAVVRTSAVLRSRGWIPNFGESGLYGKPPVKNALDFPGPMQAMQGIDPAMGTAGDHDQIGHLTEAAADYMIRPSPVTLASLRAEAEWVANACMHLRNDDGSMLDVIGRHLRRVNDGAPGGTLLWINNMPARTPGFVYLEYAHMYPCANAAWMLTDDPYLLEELQFVVQWQLIQNAWTRRWGEVSFGQQRALAWELRDLFLAAATSPAAPPKWLLSKNYFGQSLKATLARAMNFVNSTARIHAYFRCWPRTDISDAWMGAFLTAQVGIGVQMGFTDWKPVFDWAIQQHIAQTNGTSGWNRQVCAPYEWFPNKTTIPFQGLQGPTYDANTCADWADCWAYMKAGAIPNDKPTNARGSPNYRNYNLVNGVGSGTIDDAAWDGHTLMTGYCGQGTSFIGHVRAALAQAMNLGNADARIGYDYINSELPITLRKHGVFGQARFSIDPVTSGTAVMAVAAPDQAPAPPEVHASWIPKPGQYADIPTVNMANDVMPSFYPPNADPIFVNWSGAAYVPEFSKLGAMVYEGGGHGVVRDGKLILDLTTLRWSFANATTRAWPESVADQYGMRPDGAAFSPHTFHGVQAFPRAWGGGPKGSVIRFFVPGGDRKNAVWVADISKPVLGWSRMVDAMEMAPKHDTGSYPVTAIDESRKGWWVGIYAAADRIIFLRHDGAQIRHPVGLNTNGSHFTRDPTRDVLVRIDNTEVTAPLKIWELDCRRPNGWMSRPLVLDTSIPSREFLPGYAPNLYNRSAPYRNYFAGSGLQWSSILNAFVLFQDAGKPNVWIFSFEGDHYRVRLETLSPAPGTGPVAYALDGNRQPLHNGNWSKFREVPALRCFIWAAAGGKKPQAFRLRGM